MWTQTEYLDRLGLSFEHDVLERLARVETFFTDLAGAPFDAMFIGSRVDERGVPQFGTLWFFTDDFIYWSPNFRSDEAIQYRVNRRGPTRTCEIEMEDCDLSAPSGRARLSVAWSTVTEQVFSMNAHGENCRQLHDVVRAFILRPPQES